MVEHRSKKIKKVSHQKETFFVFNTLYIENLDQCFNIESASERLTSSRSKKDIEDFLNNYTCFGLFEKDNLLGFSIFSIIDNTSELIDIVIHPNQRSKGLGYNIIEQSIKELKSLNVNEIILEVEENNISAINLYKKFQAEQIGVRKNYYLNKDKSRTNALVFKIITSTL